MGKIFCLMGKSSTGKDTIFKELVDNPELQLKVIVPYTTRPIRAGETNGQEYFFVNEVEYTQLKSAGTVIEERGYSTCHGLWIYFMVDDGRIHLDNQNYGLIGTIESFVQISKYFGRDKVIPILIELDDGERLQRALDREKSQDQPKYEELCRRFLADKEDFSQEKIAQAGITKCFVNSDLKKCIEEIASYIQANKE